MLPFRSVRRALLLSPAVAAALAVPAFPQSAELPVEVEEGTSFAVAASPDGETLVMDLQGTLWRLPAAGGRAEALTDGLGDDRLPDFHPDGDRVVVQAYRAGTWDLWEVPLDGGAPVALTESGFDDREPAWSPDGTRVAFSSDRGGTYDIWILDTATGEVEPVTSDLGNESEPAWVPALGGGPEGLVFVGVAEGEPEGEIRYLALGGDAAPAPVAGSAGMVSAPSASPDGASVVFRRLHYRGLTLMGTRFDMGIASELVLAPLPAADGASEPRLLEGAGEDIFPFRPQWSGDSLLYTADGRIRKLVLVSDPETADVGSASTAPEVVPMRVELTVRRPPVRTGKVRTEIEGDIPVRGIVRPSLSPDGSRILYAALGDIWTAPLDGSEAPTPVTRDDWLDSDPIWLPDGESVAFASDRGGTMDLWEKRLDSSPGAGMVQLTSRLGAETAPALSPDGARVAWLDEQGNLHVTVRSEDLGAVRVGSGEGEALFGGRRGLGAPSWSPDGETIAVAVLTPFSSRFREGRNRVALVAASTGEARVLEEPLASFGSRDGDGPVFAPDGRSLAFAFDGGLAVLPLDASGSPAGPPRRVFAGPLDFPAWAPDGQSLTGVSGAEVVRIPVDGSSAEPIRLRHTFEAARPSGQILFQDFSVLDVEAGQLRPGMDVLVDAGRIASVEPTGAEPAEDTRVVRGGGAVLMPGLIEMHTHPMTPAFGSRLGRVHLAYGVTTIRIPAASTYRVLEEREAILAGRRVGPRVFLTGATLDGSRIYYPGAPAGTSGEVMDAGLRQARDLEFDLVKTYVRLDDASQRDAIRRSHAMGAFVTSHELYPAARYGVDGVEHIKGTSRRGFSPKVTDLGRSYGDVRSLMSVSGIFFTPTLLIYGGWDLALAREPRLLLDDPRILAFPPWIAGRLRSGPAAAADVEERLELMRPMWETVAAVARSGGRVIAGTDTPIIPYGLGLVIEVEQLSEAGLGPAAAIRSATTGAAEALGFAGELGVVAPGALADLVLLEGNPLEDISNLRRVRAVVWNGRLATLDQLLGF